MSWRKLDLSSENWSFWQNPLFVALFFCKVSFVKVSSRIRKVLKRGTALCTLLSGLEIIVFVQNHPIALNYVLQAHGQVVRWRLYFENFRYFVVAQKWYLPNRGDFWCWYYLIAQKNMKLRHQSGQKGFYTGAVLQNVCRKEVTLVKSRNFR